MPFLSYFAKVVFVAFAVAAEIFFTVLKICY